MNTDKILDFLENTLEHYKLNNALLIIPSSKKIKNIISENISKLQSNDDNNSCNNFRIIQSSKNNDSNLILEISTMSTSTTISPQIITELQSELNDI